MFSMSVLRAACLGWWPALRLQCINHEYQRHPPHSYIVYMCMCVGYRVELQVEERQQSAPYHPPSADQGKIQVGHKARLQPLFSWKDAGGLLKVHLQWTTEMSIQPQCLPYNIIIFTFTGTSGTMSIYV